MNFLMNFLRPRSTSDVFLLIANILPLLGVMLWGWKVFDILLIFWLENVVIGIFNVVKMLSWIQYCRLYIALPIVPFFILHYGGFTAGHGIFILAIFDAQSKISTDTIWQTLHAGGWNMYLAIGGIFLSHLFSFISNFLGKREIERTHIGLLMTAPYGRIVVMHLTIIIGGGAALALGQPLWALALLVLLKTGMDLKAHRKSHEKQANPEKITAAIKALTERKSGVR